MADPRRRGLVFDLPVALSSTWLFNCYGLVDDDSVVLVDPGLPSTARGALETIADSNEVDVDAAALSMIATHGHADHLAGMPTVVADRDRPGVGPTHTHLPGRCEGYRQGETPRNFGHDATIRFLPMYAQQPFSFTAVRELVTDARSIGYGGLSADFRFPYAPTGYLIDGAAVPGAPGWEVIATPGHTDDSIAFHHRASATLLSGDAVVTHDGRAWFNPEWVDVADAAETEDRLRSLEVRYLLPGHGQPIEGAVWAGARSMRDCPPGRGLLTRCARRFGRWGA